VSLRSKLLLAQLPLLAALLFVAAVGGYAATELGRRSQNILRDNYRSVLAAQRMGDSVAQIERGALFFVAGERERGSGEIAEARASFGRELAVEQSNLTEPGEADAANKLAALWQRLDTELAVLRAGDSPAAFRAAYFERLLPVLRDTKQEADVVLALNQDAMVRKSDSAERASTQLNEWIALAATLGFVCGVAASGFMTTRLLRPLSVLSQTARRLGEGDTEVRARVGGRDEIAQVASEFNTMADRLAQYRESTLGQLLAAHRAAQAVIDSLDDPIVVLGIDGGLLHLNSAAESLLRLRLDTGLESVTPELRAALERVREHVLGGRGAYQPKGLDEALRVRGPDGERRLLPRGMPVYSEEGGIAGATIVLEDVTRLQKFEELRNDRVATVAHEFRTPLTSLHMAIHLLHEQSVGPLSEKQADLVHAAREDCERLQGIVDELLDLSRIQSGRLELHRSDADIESLARMAVETARATAEQRKVELRCEVLPGQGSLSVDAERIALVFGNLLANAIRHSAPGSTVRVRADVTPQSVRYEVADAGPGVPRELRAEVFEKYFQLPGSPSGAAGLGLFIAREIVIAHGGEIGVGDEPGGGALFWFTLPRVTSSS
jgi:two-component system, NtrC family, sensor histidine kinase KinB